MKRRISAVAALASAALAVIGCTSSRSPEPRPEPTSASVTLSTGGPDATDPPPGTVRVTFDTPGSDPRPIKETVAPIDTATSSLSMDISSVTYRGVVCGFTFRGVQRPVSPVRIAMTGTVGARRFDSGGVAVSWAGDKASAGGTSDDAGGWNFLADATPSRNGTGWVVQLGAVPKSTGDADNGATPTDVRCVLSSDEAFTSVHGPVGYWAGFATR